MVKGDFRIMSDEKIKDIEQRVSRLEKMMVNISGILDFYIKKINSKQD